MSFSTDHSSPAAECGWTPVTVRLEGERRLRGAVRGWGAGNPPVRFQIDGGVDAQIARCEATEPSGSGSAAAATAAAKPTLRDHLFEILGLDPGQGFSSEGSSSSDIELVTSFLGKYLWPAHRAGVRVRVVLAAVLLLASSALGVCVPLLVKRLVDRLTVSGAAAGPLALPVGLLLAFYGTKLVQVCCQEGRLYCLSSVIQRATRLVSRDLFAHLLDVDLSYHVERQTGALAQTLDRGCRAISQFLEAALSTWVPAVIESSLVFTLLFFRYGARYALTSLLFLTAYTVWTVTIIDWRVRIRKRMNKAEERASAKLVDSVINVEGVKLFTNERLEAEAYEAELRAYERAALISTRSVNLLNAGQGLLNATGLIAVLAMASQGVVSGRMSVGDLVAINGLLTQLYLPLEYLGWAWREMRQALIDLRRLIALTELPAADTEAGVELEVTTGLVEFHEVCFSYPNGRRVLDRVSFAVRPGTTTAIVGPTGSGKSTVLKLLFRLFEPSSGAVRIDGTDIRDARLSSLRGRVGVVPQDCALFNESIAYNVRYGRPSATEEEVREAERAAQLTQALSRFPLGDATIVGERGAKLSGGEKQRVAIARTLLKNPPILLLDEATAALDSATERAIVRELKALAAHRTTLVVAHRLATIKDADEARAPPALPAPPPEAAQIIVLEAGRIVERGSHDELLARNGLYHSMWRRQKGAPPSMPPLLNSTPPNPSASGPAPSGSPR
eukprot:tig00021352_g20685.t1